MPAEVKIMLSADTKGAQQTVKKLQKDLEALNKIKDKSSANKGYMSKEEVDSFKKIHESFNSDYQKYSETLMRNARQIKQESDRLTTAMKSQMSDSAKSTYNRQLQSLQNQKKMVEASLLRAQGINQSGQQAAGDIGEGKQLPGFVAMGKSAVVLSILGVGINKLMSEASKGYNLYVGTLRQSGTLAQKTGQFGSNYEGLRSLAESTGMKSNYDTETTLGTMQTYSSVAGVKNWNNASKDVQSFQEFGRAYGVDPNIMASAAGDASKKGIGVEGDQKKFANILANSIQSRGMQGREEELVKSTDNLITALEANTLGMTDKQFGNIMNLQTALTGIDPAMKGEKGASVMSSMSNSITNGDQQMNLLLGWGTELQGPAGMWELNKRKQAGLLDEKNLPNIMKNSSKLYGDNSDMQKLQLQERFPGVPAKVIEYLVSNGKAIGNGSLNMNQQQIDDLAKQGGADTADKLGIYKNSAVAGVDKYETMVKAIDSNIGAMALKLAQPWQVMVTNLGVTGGSIGKIAGIGAGTAATALTAKKALPWILDKFGKAGATSIGEATGEVAAGAGTLSKLAPALKFGGKLLGPGVAAVGEGINVMNAAPGNKANTAIAGGAGIAGMMAGGYYGAMAGSVLGPVGTVLGGLFGSGLGYITSKAGANAVLPKHALGLNSVPYDGYVASLHKNESILTSSESDTWRAFKSMASGMANPGSNQSSVHTINIKITGDVVGLSGVQRGEVVNAVKGVFSPDNKELLNLLSGNNGRRMG
jgi:hypothetical protein